MTVSTNINKFIKFMPQIKHNYIECEICGCFNIDKSSNSETVFNALGYLNVDDKCYCSKCYKRYLEINSNNMQHDKKPENRPNKIQYYLDIAKVVASRSTCLRRKYGAIIVKDDSIISTGYNGSPRGTINCIDLNECRREKLNIPRGQCYEMCRSVHAEQNCIINASRTDMIGSTLYLYGMNAKTNTLIEDLDSCQLCKKLIINAGITTIVFPKVNNGYSIVNVDTWVKEDESLTGKFGY